MDKHIFPDVALMIPLTVCSCIVTEIYFHNYGQEKGITQTVNLSMIKVFSEIKDVPGGMSDF